MSNIKRTMINKIIFSGKRSLSWHDVEKYLQKYSGRIVRVDETGDRIRIGSHFSREYCGSKYTKNLHGTIEKVKANVAQIIIEIIQNATNRRWVENKADKHNNDAKGGWYRYDVFFSMPVIFGDNKILNDYKATMVVRINDAGIYIHDIINIKKEDSRPFESDDRTV